MSAIDSKLLAYAQLMRLANVFTAVADPLAGWFAIGGGNPPSQLLLLVGASACLYTSGIVFNDCFDFAIDQQERPNRPLPSGAIARSTAWTLAVTLMIVGLAFAALAGEFAAVIGVFLAVMILFYNAWAKHITALGPLTLGACRFANFMLGMRCAPLRLWWMPATLGVYVAVLSFIARNEATKPALRLIVKRMLLGIIVVDALMVAGRGDWVGAALVLSLLVPAIVLGKFLAMT